MDPTQWKEALTAVLEESRKAPADRDAGRYEKAVAAIDGLLRSSSPPAGVDGPGEKESWKKDLAELRTGFAQIRKDLDAQIEEARGWKRRALITRVPDRFVPSASPVPIPLFRFEDPSLSRIMFDQCRAIKEAAETGVRSKELTPDSGPEGGFTIATEISDAIFSALQRASVLERLAGPVPLPRGILHILRRLTMGLAYWRAAGVAGTKTTPTLGTMEMSAETLLALIDVDLELEEDSAINVGNFIVSTFLWIMGWETDRVLASGTGIAADGGITGLFNSDRVTSVVQATGTGIATMAWADICAMEAAVWEEGLDRSTWLANRYTKTRFTQLGDGAARPLWQPASIGEPATLMGYPHAVSGRVPGTSASGASTKYLAFGDFLTGLKFGRRGSLVVDFSSIPGWTTLQKTWRCYQRIDAAVMGYTAAEIAAEPALANPLAVLQTAAA